MKAFDYTAAHEALVLGLIHTIKEMHSEFLLRQVQQKSLVAEAENNLEKSKEQEKEPEMLTDEPQVLREFSAILPADEFCQETEETMESFGILLACFDLSMRLDKKLQLLGKDIGVYKEKTSSSIKEVREIIAELEQLLNHLSTISDAKDEMARIEKGLAESKEQLAELEQRLASPALQSPDRLDAAESTAESIINDGSNEYFSLVELPLSELPENDLRADIKMNAIATFFGEVVDKSLSLPFTTYGQCIAALKAQYAAFSQGDKNLEEVNQFQRDCNTIMRNHLLKANTPVSGVKLKKLQEGFNAHMATRKLPVVLESCGSNLNVSFFSLKSRSSQRSNRAEDRPLFLRMEGDSPKQR